MHKKSNTKQLIIFIKNPIPGQCKTRLNPYLDKYQASEFYKELVIACLNNAKKVNDIDIAIYTTPDINHPFILQLNKQYGVPVHQQTGHNLGQRMYNALHESLTTHSQCVLIGSDCPLLDAQYIETAFLKLDKHDTVIGPAEDGGYVLIGAKQVQPKMFDDIDWGQSHVLEQNLKKIKQCQYSVALLDTLWDIDTPDDYIRYIETFTR